MHKIAVFSSYWYNEAKPLESLEFIKSCGFEAIDYNINEFVEPRSLTKDNLKTNGAFFLQSKEELIKYYTPLKEAIEKTGVTLCQMHAPFPCWFEDKDVYAYCIEALDKCFAVSEFLGCPSVIVHPSYPTETKSEWEIDIELYEDLIPYIKKYKGVQICLENIFGRTKSIIVDGRLSNVDMICKMIDHLNDKAGGNYFGLCLDVGHATLVRANLKEYIIKLGSRLTNLHTHDNNGGEDQHLIPYSCMTDTFEFVTDWDGFVEGLKAVNYQGDITFESFRQIKKCPKTIMPELLKLTSAIGRYFKEEIEK